MRPCAAPGAVKRQDARRNITLGENNTAADAAASNLHTQPIWGTNTVPNLVTKPLGHPPSLGSVTVGAPAFVLTAPHYPTPRCREAGVRAAEKHAQCFGVQAVVWGVFVGDASPEAIAEWVLQQLP